MSSSAKNHENMRKCFQNDLRSGLALAHVDRRLVSIIRDSFP
jgi:hypothetical protein